MKLKSRGKLLLISIVPLILITTLVVSVFYLNGVSNLTRQAEFYRNDLLDARKAELQAHLRMGRTAIKNLYESDVAGENKEQAKIILKNMRFAMTAISLPMIHPVLIRCMPSNQSWKGKTCTT